jgi:hypothetical protein
MLDKQPEYMEVLMEETLESLEKKRKELYEELEALGDFRRGTISVNYRKCGKKKCVCTKPGHPGHGPQYLWKSNKGYSTLEHRKAIMNNGICKFHRKTFLKDYLQLSFSL